MTVRREVLVLVLLGACAWFIGLNVGEAMSRAGADEGRGRGIQVKEHEPPTAGFHIRRAA